MFGLVNRPPSESHAAAAVILLLLFWTKDGTAINLLSLESCMHIFTKGPHPPLRHKQKKKKGRERSPVGWSVIWWWWWSSVHHFLSLSLSAREHVVIIHQYTESPFFYDFCPFFTNFTSAAAAAAAAVCVLCWFIWHSSSSSSQYKASNRRQQTGSNSSVIGVYNNILRNPTTICRTMSSLGGAECYVMGDVVAAFYTRVFLHAGVRGSFSPSVRG